MLKYINENLPQIPHVNKVDLNLNFYSQQCCVLIWLILVMYFLPCLFFNLTLSVVQPISLITSVSAFVVY